MGIFTQSETRFSLPVGGSGGGGGSGVTPTDSRATPTCSGVTPELKAINIDE